MGRQSRAAVFIVKQLSTETKRDMRQLRIADRLIGDGQPTLFGRMLLPIFSGFLYPARFADTRPAVIDICVAAVVMMTSRAACLCGIFGGQRKAASYVFRARDYFKVAWIAAGGNATKVVDYLVRRYLAMSALIHEAVNEYAPFVNSGHAVAVPVPQAIPKPAAVCRFGDENFEPPFYIDNRFVARDVHGVAVSALSRVVLAAKHVAVNEIVTSVNLANAFISRHLGTPLFNGSRHYES